uniref:Transposase n=1 Tax=Panagrolaimus sp. JU765 TaxID=591449 RepID=A0AC34QXV3_9BILA
MLQYSKSFRTIRTRTESLYDRARRKLTSSFRGDKTNCLESERKSSRNVDQFLITEDFHAEGQADCISVFRGERVELLDNFSSTDQDVIAVNVIDEETNLPSQRRGNVPMKILFAIDAALKF